MGRKLSLIHVLIIANAIILLAAAGVRRDMTRRHGDLVYGLNARNAQRTADAGVADLAWREYASTVTEIGRQIAQTSSDLRQALSDKNGAGAEAALKDEFFRGAISSGQIKVVGLSAYDPSIAVV